jgi:glucose/arabinose dehydrogenase
MKKTCLLTLSLALLATPLAAAEINRTSSLADTSAAPMVPDGDQQFANVIDDLPLMPGLAVVPQDDVLFVTPRAGRIAETTASGAVDIDDVYRFYSRTLPQLGWINVDARRYRRANEILRIDAHAEGKVTMVTFSVKPNVTK